MVENVVYPAYFDADRSRSEGRRVPMDLAIEEPTVDEIAKAVQQGWVRRGDRTRENLLGSFKPRGAVVVRGTEDTAKNDLVQAIAAYLGVIRGRRCAALVPSSAPPAGSQSHAPRRALSRRADGSSVVDESLATVGRVVDVFGPVDRPYVAVTPNDDDLAALVGGKLYAR